ncbi:hypothetical protein H8356DRAFT_1433681 [Neocallimastix lanati (nom. inval.)]|nr:hypothetical protein H8356DRAFT_1433681 [Neocallimastix sp. JGI-2020a]
MINCHTSTAKETPYRSTLRDPLGKAEPTIGAGHCKSSQTRLTQWDSNSCGGVHLNSPLKMQKRFSLRELLSIIYVSGIRLNNNNRTTNRIRSTHDRYCFNEIAPKYTEQFTPCELFKRVVHLKLSLFLNFSNCSSFKAENSTKKEYANIFIEKNFHSLMKSKASPLYNEKG